MFGISCPTRTVNHVMMTKDMGTRISMSSLCCWWKLRICLGSGRRKWWVIVEWMTSQARLSWFEKQQVISTRCTILIVTCTLWSLQGLLVLKCEMLSLPLQMRSLQMLSLSLQRQPLEMLSRPLQMQSAALKKHLAHTFQFLPVADVNRALPFRPIAFLGKNFVTWAVRWGKLGLDNARHSVLYLPCVKFLHTLVQLQHTWWTCLCFRALSCYQSSL